MVQEPLEPGTLRPVTANAVTEADEVTPLNPPEVQLPLMVVAGRVMTSPPGSASEKLTPVGPVTFALAVTTKDMVVSVPTATVDGVKNLPNVGDTMLVILSVALPCEGGALVQSTPATLFGLLPAVAPAVTVIARVQLPPGASTIAPAVTTVTLFDAVALDPGVQLMVRLPVPDGVDMPVAPAG